jgi:hypothetical protein
MPCIFSDMQMAHQAEKEAIQTERRLYRELMAHLRDSEAGNKFGRQNNLLQEWETAMQTKLESSSLCIRLANSALRQQSGQ